MQKVANGVVWVSCGMWIAQGHLEIR